MKSLILKLARIADELDRSGQVHLANDLDQVISSLVPGASELSEQNKASLSEEELLEVDIPEEEREVLEQVLESLQKSLS